MALILYGVTHWSGDIVEVVLAGVLLLLATVNSAGIVKAQKEKEINKFIDRRLQNRR